MAATEYSMAGSHAASAGAGGMNRKPPVAAISQPRRTVIRLAAPRVANAGCSAAGLLSMRCDQTWYQTKTHSSEACNSHCHRAKSAVLLKEICWRAKARAERVRRPPIPVMVSSSFMPRKGLQNRAAVSAAHCDIMTHIPPDHNPRGVGPGFGDALGWRSMI